VEIFYWIVKRLHLQKLSEAYGNALKSPNENPAIKLSPLKNACLEQLVEDLTMELEVITRLDYMIQRRFNDITLEDRL